MFRPLTFSIWEFDMDIQKNIYLTKKIEFYFLKSNCEQTYV